MKRMRDDKSISRNLKNIRIDFIIENLLIIVLLAWQIFRGGDWYRVTSFSNPLYAVLMIAALALIVLSVNISEPMKHKVKSSIPAMIARFVLESLIFTAILYLIIEGNHPIVSTLSGIGIALFLLGANIYANRFRKSK